MTILVYVMTPSLGQAVTYDVMPFSMIKKPEIEGMCGGVMIGFKVPWDSITR